MDVCCQNTYNHTFSRKRADQEYRNYLKKGPKKSTVYLLEPLKSQELKGASLLDIGGGVGTVVWELWERGIQKVYYQEISEAYSQFFQGEVVKRGLQEVVEIRTGDFVEFHDKFPDVDIVTLDKVICCYQDFKALVKRSVVKARHIYAYTVPRDIWWVRMVVAVESFFKRLISDQLQTYVHPLQEMENLTVAEGFEKIYERQHREWYTVLYRRAKS